MTTSDRNVTWELRIGGTNTRIAVNPPKQVEQLLGWQTNVLNVDLLDDVSVAAGTNVVLRYVDLDLSQRSTQFAGEIDNVSGEHTPYQQSISCVGPLIRLNRVRQGGRLNLTGMTDGEAVRSILRECGLSFNNTDIADAGYVLGDRVPIFWPRGTSGADMIAKIDEVFGTATRELPNGKIGRWFYDLVPRSVDIRKSYTVGVDAAIYAIGRDRGGATSIQNSWEIRGATFTKTNTPDCTYQPFARAQQRNERLGRVSGGSSFQSDIIQDDLLARAIARRMMRWYNREPDTLILEVENDPNIMPGATIGVTDAVHSIHLVTEKPYLVLTVDRNGPTMQLNCIGGNSGDVGSIDHGYDKTCNETSTESDALPDDFSADAGYTDPNSPCPGDSYCAPSDTSETITIPGEVADESLFSDLGGTTAAGDCGDVTTLGPAQWFRNVDVADAWQCSAEDDCSEVLCASDSAVIAVNTSLEQSEELDAITPSPLKTTVTGELWFSDHADGIPSLAIEMYLPDEEQYASATIRTGGATNASYGALLRTDFSEELTASEFELHPGCVEDAVANNGTWNFYNRVPVKGTWHSFEVTFWEDNADSFVPRTTLTLNDYTEYADDARCTTTATTCADSHAAGHFVRFKVLDEGTRSDDFAADPPVRLRNVTVSRLLLDPSTSLVNDAPATCAPNPNYTPGTPVAGCGPDEPLCNCTPALLGTTYLRDGGSMWDHSDDGTTATYQATTASSIGFINTNAAKTEANDLVIDSPANFSLSGEFAFGVAGVGNDAMFCVSVVPRDNASNQNAQVCVYSDDHSVWLDTGMSVTMQTETSRPPAEQLSVMGDKHPVCPWGPLQATTGAWNFENLDVTVGDWHSFAVAVDESTTPQRLYLTIDGYTEYVEDIWFDEGTCDAAAGHPGALCSATHTNDHRLKLSFSATGGTYGATSAEGGPVSVGHITPQSGGNTSGTSAEKTFNGPYDMDVLSDGRLVVTDLLNLGIKIFDDGNNWYRDAAPTWTLATATYPWGVAVIDDVIYVVLQNGKIRVYNSSGVYQSTLTQNITSGRRAAAGPDGYIYVAQADGLNRVAVVTTTGTVVRYIGSAGTGNGQFGSSGPGGIAFDSSNNVYVADRTGQRINVYSSNGTYLTHWGNAGFDPGQFSVPEGIAIRDETVFVVNRNSVTASSSKLQMYGLDGSFKQEWYGTTNGTTGTAPAATDKFGYPSSVVVSGEKVFVTDGYGGIGTTGRNEVRRFTSAVPSTGTPLGYVRGMSLTQANAGTCYRNPDYKPGFTGGNSPWQ